VTITIHGVCITAEIQAEGILASDEFFANAAKNVT
jgi:hypothetical protein